MKSYFCLTIIRVFIKESKIDILRNIKKQDASQDEVTKDHKT